MALLPLCFCYPSQWPLRSHLLTRNIHRPPYRQLYKENKSLDWLEHKHKKKRYSPLRTDASRRTGNLHTNDCPVTSTPCPRGLPRRVPLLHPPPAHGSFHAQIQCHRCPGRAVQFQPWVGVHRIKQQKAAILTQGPLY